MALCHEHLLAGLSGKQLSLVMARVMQLVYCAQVRYLALIMITHLMRLLYCAQVYSFTCVVGGFYMLQCNAVVNLKLSDACCSYRFVLWLRRDRHIRTAATRPPTNKCMMLRNVFISQKSAVEKCVFL